MHLERMSSAHATCFALPSKVQEALERALMASAASLPSFFDDHGGFLVLAGFGLGRAFLFPAFRAGALLEPFDAAFAFAGLAEEFDAFVVSAGVGDVVVCHLVFLSFADTLILPQVR